MTTTKTLQETYDSLSGFDEIAIRREFRETVAQLVDGEDRTRMQRALVFIDLRRGGATDAEAYEQAMGAPWAEIRDYFASEPVDPTQPAPSEPQPTS